MKTRTLYWFLMPLAVAVYIVAMASAQAGPDRGKGPRDYASPGHHYGVGHGRGQPNKTP